MTKCKWCYDKDNDTLEELTFLSYGDERWSYCPNCHMNEPDTIDVEEEDED